MENIKNKIREMTTQQIFECVVIIGGGQVDEEHRLVRACLLDIYQEREGEGAVDALLEVIGM